MLMALYYSKIEKIKKSVLRRIEKRSKTKNLSIEQTRLAEELELGRIELGLSQAEFAKKVGINMITYRNLIGTTIPAKKPKDVTLRKLSVFMGKDPLYFNSILNANSFPRDRSYWMTEFVEYTYDINLMDECGYLFKIDKKIINVALDDNLSCYVHALATEGVLDKNSVCVSPGEVESIKHPRMHWYIKQHFPSSYNKGEKAIINLKYSIFYRREPGDQKDMNYNTYKFVSPIKVILINIIFPIERPCLSYEVRKWQNTLEEILCTGETSVRKGEDGRTRILWKLEKPEFLGEYTIYWKW
jgi:hypothetical protein